MTALLAPTQGREGASLVRLFIATRSRQALQGTGSGTAALAKWRRECGQSGYGPIAVSPKLKLVRPAWDVSGGLR